MHTGVEMTAQIREVINQNPWLKPYLLFLDAGLAQVADRFREEIVDRFIRTRVQCFSEYVWMKLHLTEEGRRENYEDKDIIVTARFVVIYKNLTTGQIEHLDHVSKENGDTEILPSTQVLMERIITDKKDIEFLGVLWFECIIRPGEQKPPYNLRLYRYPHGYLSEA